MGAYNYRLAPPSQVIRAKLNGEEVAVGVLHYAYKPSGADVFGRKSQTDWNRYVGPSERAWGDREKPRYAVVAFGTPPKISNGNPVLAWEQSRIAVTDDPNWNGLAIVGYIRDGVIVPTYEEASRPGPFLSPQERDAYTMYCESMRARGTEPAMLEHWRETRAKGAK